MKCPPTREEWLLRAIEELRPLFQAQGHKIPKVSVSCGWPSGNVRKVDGECWAKTKARPASIFISPSIQSVTGRTGVLGALVHELIHAVLGQGVGHKKPFADLAKALGLEGKMTATVAGTALIETFKDIETKIGPYPNQPIVLGPKVKDKKNTRLLKVACPTCDYIVRVTRKHLDEKGAPICPVCEIPFEETD